MSYFPFPDHVQPRLHVVPAGSVLWRVTREPDPTTESPTGVPLFQRCDAEPSRSHPSRGGRFDPCPRHEYGYCYVALDDFTALAETLLRDAVFDGEIRALTAEEIRDRRLILLEARRELQLISLVTLQDLAAAQQDTWLVHAGQDQYRFTRCWGHWLRDGAPSADGIIWPSKRNPDGRAVVLFQDRCDKVIALSGLGFRRLDDAASLDWLNDRLSLVQTYVVPEGAEAGNGTR
jgi:hypothetical protein